MRFRKVFIDSRWRSSGAHNDFTVELPQDVDTTATASVYVASLSFSNTLETVTANVDNKLYMLLRRPGELPGAAFVWISPGRYTGTTLATEIQNKLRAATLSTAYTVTFDETYGRISFARSDGGFIQLPTDGELRDHAWKLANWDPYTTHHQYSAADPQSLNAILYFPKPSSLQATVTSGNIDLVPYREVYLHSNLTTFRTLKCGTGEQDCLARIPIDADYGFVVVWKHQGPSDAIAVPTAQLRNLTFSLRDWAGRLVPVDQPVVIELVFLDNDVYNL